MADNFLSDNTENIFVEQQYNNIILVDPNKILDSDGNIKERLVNHENLITYVNLEAEVLPRTKLAVGGSPQDVSTTVSIAKINFLAPNGKESYFTDGYYDELTGDNTTRGQGDNQRQETVVQGVKNSKPYVKSTITSNGYSKSIDNGLLGIKSINIKTGTSFIPTVTMSLEDIQGRALFQLGDQSPYAAFVNLPYPPFYLTIKGFYGKAVRYQLNLEKFNARYRGQDGNYELTLEFRGYKFNILNEIEVGNLLATPHMYSSSYAVTTPTNQTQSSDVVESVVTEKGYEKIIQVYSEYKSKGLIPLDFPELTLAQFLNKIETFETNIVQNYPKANIQPLTDCRDYKKKLGQYYTTVFSQDLNSWYSKWIFPKPLISFVNGTKKEFFLFKEGFTSIQKGNAESELQSIIDEYKNKLDNTGVLGLNGKSKIINDISLGDFIIRNFDTNTLDMEATTTSITSVVKPQVTPKVVLSLINRINSVSLNDNINDQTATNGNEVSVLTEPVVSFETFVNKIKRMDSEASTKLGEYETLITEDLSKKFEDDRLGIGFSPTVRNITAIIMASTEAFIRLMDDVHTTAWNQRNNDVRRKIILNNSVSAPSPDSKQNLNTALNAGQPLASSSEPVYPWPQFFVETSDDKKGKFQIQYIGSPSYISQTGGNNYDVWPEVEFVEEYLKGLTQKFDPPLTQPPTNQNDVTNLININAIEFPQGNIAYRNKEEIKFFYEIYERQFITSHYTGFFRAANNNLTLLIEAVQDYESQNIINSLSTGAPSLATKLKEYDFNSTNYVLRLKEFSNQGTGRNYQDFIRDFFVTPYLRSLTENSFSILETWQEGPIPQNGLTEVVNKIKQVLDTTNNDFTIMDTYPFTYTPWTSRNMTNLSANQYNLVFNTDRTLTVYNPRNVIASFKEITNHDYARPVTNFNYQYASKKSVSLPRLNANDLLPTEGFAGNSVTSILNTPYFINAILEGVNNSKQKKQYPYVAAAYLFLNSLPLISLKEQLKTKREGLDYELNDYMFAVLKKFGAIHKIPYAWILKVGSIWHRYKIFKEKNIDIISESWKDFDFLTGYDPITKSPEKKYSFTSKGQTIDIQMSSNDNQTYNTEVGFYPKVINDFNYFCNGVDLFKDYSNNELQDAVNRGLKIINLPSSNISNISSGNFVLNLKTWSVMFPVNDIVIDIRECAPQLESTISTMLVFPSFGSNKNQAFEKVQQGGVMNSGTAFNGNNSIFNGSCRLYWAAPNEGYFDTSTLKKPATTEYMNSIESQTSNVAPFRILNIEEEYSNIEELFSVFDKKILDSFEKEFLNFSKKDTDISIAEKTTILYDGAANNADLYRNFQGLFRNMMKVSLMNENQTESSYFINSINEQHKVLQSQIASFLNYDVIFRYGNPMNYNERIFNSFISKGNNNDIVENPIDFSSYVKNTLPSKGGTITLTQSKQQFQKEWKELELQVGYSTIEELKYSDNGSYITDFFIDNNIGFTVDNIVLLSPLIKIYATQKLKNSSINSNSFVSQLTSLNTTTSNLQNNLLDGVLNLVRKNLPPEQASVETTFNSVVDGDVTKVQTYDKLKALNDKWIAGGDYSNKTYFEDILFLDRASRNIGDVLLVDIFKIKNMLRKSAVDSNLKMSVYTLLAGLLIDNNFVIMNLPAYVNFYNVQSENGVGGTVQENSSEFANNLWGTFLSVDYSNASPKMVCFYTGKPSQYLDLPETNFYRFRSDGDDVNKQPCSMIEEVTNKNDFEKSNRCVGFSVDIGIRNQNVFQSFNVGQDNGKATAEVVNTVYNLASQASGVNVATQSTGLYNLYTQRSYTCEISMLGNAMIQPTMYFNLKHVPMFNGSYMIQEVSHVISPGVFTTSIKGIRQSMFDLPQIDKYLQSLNRNLLTKLEEIVRVNKSSVPTLPITNQQKTNDIQSSNSNSPSVPNACNNSVLPVYLNDGFIPTETVAVQITPQQLYDSIQLATTQFGGNPVITKMIYSFCYVTNFQNGVFVGYNNNFSSRIDLTNSFSPTYNNFFENKYCCISTDDLGQKQSIPLATFKSLDTFVSFLFNRFKSVWPKAEKEGLWKYYCCDYPTIKKTSSSEFQKNKLTNDTYQQVLKRLTLGISSMKNLNVDVSDIDQILTGKTKTVTSPVIKTDAPQCEGPKIISWEPKTSDYNSLSPEIRISGTSLWGNGKTNVSLSGVSCTIKFNDEKLLVVVPKKKINGKIRISNVYGSDDTDVDFIFTNLPVTTG